MTRLLTIGVALCVAIPLVGSQSPALAPSTRVSGAALGLFASEADYDYGGLVREIAARGATDLLVVPRLRQTDVHSSDPSLGAEELDALRKTVAQAHAEQLRVGVMPIIEIERATPAEWRARLAPGGELDAWFAAYEAEIVRLARLCEALGVQRLGLGSELASLEGFEQRWRGLASRVRRHFSGALFYAVNWDRLDRVHFWDALDEIGVSGYFSLARPGASITEAELDRAWDQPRQTLERLALREDKPYFFAEIGYPSRPHAAARPWDHHTEGSVALTLQATLWRAFCREFSESPGYGGFYAWNWFGVGGVRDTGYTPRGKPAAAELERCWETERSRAVSSPFKDQDRTDASSG